MRPHQHASIGACLAYYTECALATVESLPERTSQRARARFEIIADEMVESCARFTCREDRKACPRLIRLFNEKAAKRKGTHAY